MGVKSNATLPTCLFQYYYLGQSWTFGHYRIFVIVNPSLKNKLTAAECHTDKKETNKLIWPLFVNYFFDIDLAMFLVCLSRAGKLTLIKSNVSGMPNHVMSCFKCLIMWCLVLSTFLRWLKRWTNDAKPSSGVGTVPLLLPGRMFACRKTLVALVSNWLINLILLL